MSEDNGGHLKDENQSVTAAARAAAIVDLRDTTRRRFTYMRMENRHVLAIKAKAREAAVARLRAAGEALPAGRFPKPNAEDAAAVAELYPELIECQGIHHRARLVMEKRMVQLAEPLPGLRLVEEVHGFGVMGLAIIVGLSGDLSGYPHYRMLWRRFGLDVQDGKAPKKRRGIANGYSPARRSAIFTIGDALIKKQNLYRELYLESKQVYAAKWPEASKMHVHRAAQRYMEKRLLKHLWQRWRLECAL